MRIFTRKRRPEPPRSIPRSTDTRHIDVLATSIADSQARFLAVADRVAAGRAEPGDEARLRIQREIIVSYRKRLEKIALPTTLGDDAEAWLRSLAADARQTETH